MCTINKNFLNFIMRLIIYFTLILIAYSFDMNEFEEREDKCCGPCRHFCKDGAPGVDADPCYVQPVLNVNCSVIYCPGNHSTTLLCNGTTGPQGRPGVDGRNGTDGINGTDGQSCIIIENPTPNCTTLSCPNNNLITICNGTDGATGPIGPTGPPGSLTLNTIRMECSLTQGAVPSGTIIQHLCSCPVSNPVIISMGCRTLTDSAFAVHSISATDNGNTGICDWISVFASQAGAQLIVRLYCGV